jgi:hypothetical protein
MKSAPILPLLMLAGHQLTTAAPLTTAFNYSGQLQVSGLPANGLFDFQFAIGAAESGEWLRGAYGIEDVPVSNGLFTVSIDFGESVLNGDRRWLEIAVRDGSTAGAFTTLLPRQELGASPYALFAKEAGHAATAAQVQWSNIAGLPPDFADGTDANNTYSAGAGLSLSGNTFSIPLSGVNNAMLAGSIALSKLSAAGAGDGQVIKFNASGNKWEVASDNAGATYTVGVGLSLFDNTIALGTVPLDHLNTAGAIPGSALTFDGGAVRWASPPAPLGLPYLGAASPAFGDAAFAVRNDAAPEVGLFFPGPAIAGTHSSSGVGVWGASHDGRGVSGVSESGEGVRGAHSGAEGSAPGVRGLTSSISYNATGVKGEVTSTNSIAYSAGVLGVNRGVSWGGSGVLGTHEGSGVGVLGFSQRGAGVLGWSVEGPGVRASAPTPSGTALEIHQGAIRVTSAGVNTPTASFILEATLQNMRNEEGAEVPTLVVIDNPQTNDDPDAMILVTPHSQRTGKRGMRGIPGQVGVVYDDDGTLAGVQGRWLVWAWGFAGGGDPFRLGLIPGDRFNVLVMGSAEERWDGPVEGVIRNGPLWDILAPKD